MVSATLSPLNVSRYNFGLSEQAGIARESQEAEGSSGRHGWGIGKTHVPFKPAWSALKRQSHCPGGDATSGQLLWQAMLIPVLPLRFRQQGKTANWTMFGMNPNSNGGFYDEAG
jgi:hypothetical protein